MVDDRASHVSTYGGDNNDSASSITVLENDCSFLTRSCFGSCFLWDARNMGPTYRGQAVPLRRLEVPRHLIHSTKSSGCNGVALDPTQQYAISPFVSFEELPYLALWSLSSGAYIGCKELLDQEFCERTRRNPIQQDLACFHKCELSSTITPAWQPVDSAVRDSDTVETEKGAWGLWFKSAMTCEQPTPGFIGSIHHVTFPGSLDSTILHGDVGAK